MPRFFGLVVVGLLILYAVARPYHRVAIADLRASAHTHVEVQGHVDEVRLEADGDWHIRISDLSGRFVVAEIIPTLVTVPPLMPPKLHTCVVVGGIRKIDTEVGHGWAEIHPVEYWRPISCLGVK